MEFHGHLCYSYVDTSYVCFSALLVSLSNTLPLCVCCREHGRFYKNAFRFLPITAALSKSTKQRCDFWMGPSEGKPKEIRWQSSATATIGRIGFTAVDRNCSFVFPPLLRSWQELYVGGRINSSKLETSGDLLSVDRKKWSVFLFAETIPSTCRKKDQPEPAVERPTQRISGYTHWVSKRNRIPRNWSGVSSYRFQL